MIIKPYFLLNRGQQFHRQIIQVCINTFVLVMHLALHNELREKLKTKTFTRSVIYLLSRLDEGLCMKVFVNLITSLKSLPKTSHSLY